MTRIEMKVIFVCLVLLKLSLGTSVVSVRLPYVNFQNPAGVTYVEGKAPAELVAGPNRHSARIQDASHQQVTPIFTSPTAPAQLPKSTDLSSHQTEIGQGQPLNTSPIPRYFLRSHGTVPVLVSPTPHTVSHISTIAPGGIAYSTQGNRANYVYASTVPTVQKSAALVVSPAVSTAVPVTAAHHQQVLSPQPFARTVVVPSVPVQAQAVAHVPVTQIQEHHGVVQKTVNVAQPALKTRTYEVRRPAIQKQFYDIEERIIVRPAGTVVLELDQPISKVAKGEVVNTVGEANIGQPGFVLTGSHGQQQLDGSLNQGQIDYQGSNNEQLQQQPIPSGFQGNYGNFQFGVPGIVYADQNQSVQHATTGFVSTTPAPNEDDTIVVDARSSPAEHKGNLQNNDRYQENDQQPIIISTTPQYNEHVTTLQRQAIQLPPPSGNQHQLAQINEQLTRSHDQGFVPGQRQQLQQNHLQQQQQQHHFQQQQQQQPAHYIEPIFARQQEQGQHHGQQPGQYTEQAFARQQQQPHGQQPAQYTEQAFARQQQQSHGQQPGQYTEQAFVRQQQQPHEQQPAQYTEQAFVRQQQQRHGQQSAQYTEQAFARQQQPPHGQQPVQYMEQTFARQQQQAHGQQPAQYTEQTLARQQQLPQHQPTQYTEQTIGIQQQTESAHGQEPHPSARALIQQQQQSQQFQPAQNTGYAEQQADEGNSQQPHPQARANVHIQSVNSSPLMITVGDPDFRYPPYSERQTNGIPAEQVQINLNSQSGHQTAYTTQSQFSGNYETSPTLSPYQSTENQQKFLNLILAQGGVSEYGTHSDLKSDYLRSRVIAATPAPNDAAPTEERVHTRRIVISKPLETVQEVQEQEPFTKIQQVTVNHPTVYKTARLALKEVQTSVPVYAKQVPSVVPAPGGPALYQSNLVSQPVALSYQNVLH